MISLLPWPYRWLILAVLLAAVGGFGYVKGLESGEAELDAYKLSEAKQSLEIQTVTIAKTKALQLQKDEAVNAAAKREQVAQENLASARLSVGGLLDDLAAARTKLSTASLDATRKYAATAGAIFGECAQAIGELAGKAGGHASDALTLEQAWPKP